MNAEEILRKNRNRVIQKTRRTKFISPNMTRLNAAYLGKKYGTDWRDSELYNRTLKHHSALIKQKKLYNIYKDRLYKDKLHLNKLLFDFPPGKIIFNFLMDDDDALVFKFPYYRGMSFKTLKNNLFKRLNKNPLKYDMRLYIYDEDDDDYETPIEINNLIDLLEEWGSDIMINFIKL